MPWDLPPEDYRRYLLHVSRLFLEFLCKKGLTGNRRVNYYLGINLKQQHSWSVLRPLNPALERKWNTRTLQRISFSFPDSYLLSLSSFLFFHEIPCQNEIILRIHTVDYLDITLLFSSYVYLIFFYLIKEFLFSFQRIPNAERKEAKRKVKRLLPYSISFSSISLFLCSFPV